MRIRLADPGARDHDSTVSRSQKATVACASGSNSSIHDSAGHGREGVRSCNERPAMLAEAAKPGGWSDPDAGGPPRPTAKSFVVVFVGLS
jgi:hypothetical protein